MIGGDENCGKADEGKKRLERGGMAQCGGCGPETALVASEVAEERRDRAAIGVEIKCGQSVGAGELGDRVRGGIGEFAVSERGNLCREAGAAHEEERGEGEHARRVRVEHEAYYLPVTEG